MTPVFVTSMFVRRRERNIYCRKYGKYERLKKRHKNSKGDKYCRYYIMGKVSKDSQDQVVACHVHEQPEGKGYGTHQMAYDFYYEHKWGQKQNGSGKMFQVADTMLFKPIVVVHNENHNCTGDRQIEITRWRKKSGNKPQEVRKKDKEEKRPQKWEIFYSFLARPHHVCEKVKEKIYG